MGRWGYAVLVVMLTAHPPIRLSAQSRFWRPDERVLISDFSVVTALAASPWLVYAATPHGLAIYDRRSRQWQTPVTGLDGYPAARARVALADPVGNAVWLGTDIGWSRYDFDLRQWTQGSVPGGVTGLALDAQDPASGVFVQSPGGWAFLPRGALMPMPGRSLPPPGQRVQTLDVRTALARTPLADAMRAMLLTDSRLRGYQFTSAARAPDDNDLFLGTNGLGVVRLDVMTGQWDSLRFGLAATAVRALALGSGGVWAAGPAIQRNARQGLTWVDDELAATTPIEAAPGSGFGTADVRRLTASGDVLWLATDAGLFRIDPRSGDERRFDLGAGLPSEDVRCVAPAPDGVWAGTALGLAVIAAGRVQHIGTTPLPILSLLETRDTLWVGTSAGLGAVAAGASDIAVPPAVAAEPALREPVVALARVGDTLVAAGADQVAWRDPGSGRWTALRPRVTLGRITSMAADAGGVWLGGVVGLAFWNIARGSFRALVIPGDLPAPVRDLAAAASGPYVWAATDSGLVRLRRDVLNERRR
jgi:ligand-binding sensor domain-containing protein